MPTGDEESRLHRPLRDEFRCLGALNSYAMMFKRNKMIKVQQDEFMYDTFHGKHDKGGLSVAEAITFAKDEFQLPRCRAYCSSDFE